MPTEMEPKDYVIFELESIILEVATKFGDVTQSDLQGMASYQAHRIFRMAGNDPKNWKPLFLQMQWELDHANL